MKPKFSLSRSDGDVEVEGFCNDSGSAGSEVNVATLYLLCVFLAVLSVLITCGNLLVITSIMYFKQLHTNTNYLILSLAVADLLVGVVLLPFSTLLSFGSCWHLRALLCEARGAVDVFLCSSSIINLCFISVDRYYVVCRPLVYRTRINNRVTVVLILVSWTAAAVLSVIVTVLRQNRQSSIMRCNIFQGTKQSIMGVVFMSNMPAIAIVTIYIRILTVALRQARSIQKTKSNPALSKMEKKATKTLAIVVLMYLMCWSPYFLCMTLYRLITVAIPTPVIEAFKWLGWSNSMFNPFVYGFFYKWFRSAFKMILTGKIFQSDFSNTKLL